MNLRGTWKYYHSGNSPLPEGMHIRYITACPEGHIWAAIHQVIIRKVKGAEYFDGLTHGLMKYHQNQWHLYLVGEAGLPSSLGKMSMLLMACDDIGRLWMYLMPNSSRHILCCYNGSASKLFLAGKNGLPDSVSVYAFTFDTQNRCWAIMGPAGVYYFDGTIWQKSTIMDFVPKNSWITHGTCNHKGQLCFAIQSPTSTKFVKQVSDGQYENLAEMPFGYMNSLVKALRFDSNDLLWVGCDDYSDDSNFVLFVLDPQGNSRSYTNKNSAFPDNQIRDIAVDNKGRVWVASGMGLTIFDKDESVNWGFVMPNIPHKPISMEAISPNLDNVDDDSLVTVGTQVVSDNIDHVWSISHSGVSEFSEVYEMRY